MRRQEGRLRNKAMSSFQSSSKEVSVASDYNHGEDAEGQALRPSSEQMIHAKVEANHPDQGRDPEYAGMTLAQEEEARARDEEIERTRWARSMDDREQRTREVVTSELTGRPPEARTADWLERVDPALESELRTQAERIAAETDRGWTVQAIMQHLAKEIKLGKSANAAVLDVLEASKTAPGVFVEPHLVPKVDREELHVEGDVVTLWEDTDDAIFQVGLLADDQDTVKFTSWEASGMIEVQEGDHVRMRNVKKNWYQGRVSVALTGDSRIEILDRDGDEQ